MRFIAFVLCFILSSLSVFSCSSDSSVENTTKITGMVQVYGNEPHTFVGIVDEAGVEYAVYPASQEEELRKLQGHLIEFTVIFMDDPPRTEAGLYLRGGTVTPVRWVIIR